jgi:hypothetical protein
VPLTVSRDLLHDQVSQRNLFEYVRARAVNWTDPIGLQPSECCVVKEFPPASVGPCRYRRAFHDGSFSPLIEVNATFKEEGNARCKCCEYRQYVEWYRYRYRILVDGQPLTFTDETGGQVDWVVYPREGDEFWEDCVGNWCPGYRSRNENQQDEAGRFIDCYLPNRTNGCRYRTMDWPGPTGLNRYYRDFPDLWDAGRVRIEVVMHGRFLFNIVDVCRGSTVVSSQVVEIHCDGTAP